MSQNLAVCFFTVLQYRDVFLSFDSDKFREFSFAHLSLVPRIFFYFRDMVLDSDSLSSMKESYFSAFHSYPEKNSSCSTCPHVLKNIFCHIFTPNQDFKRYFIFFTPTTCFSILNLNSLKNFFYATFWLYLLNFR